MQIKRIYPGLIIFLLFLISANAHGEIYFEHEPPGATSPPPRLADHYPPPPDGGGYYSHETSTRSRAIARGEGYGATYDDGYSSTYDDRPKSKKRSRNKDMYRYSYIDDYRDDEDNGYEIDGSATSTRGAPLPGYIRTVQEKVIIIDPRVHAWGAYDPNGKLIRWGIATAGADWCDDVGRPCRTRSGSFRIYSAGDESCISSKFPLPDGGAPMPYCMYFNGSQALHGSNEVQSANLSHGCVRLHVKDARWLRYNFIEPPMGANNFRGTQVIVRSY